LGLTQPERKFESQSQHQVQTIKGEQEKIYKRSRRSFGEKTNHDWISFRACRFVMARNENNQKKLSKKEVQTFKLIFFVLHDIDKYEWVQDKRFLQTFSFSFKTDSLHTSLPCICYHSLSFLDRQSSFTYRLHSL
jgi:hypothetical protein